MTDIEIGDRIRMVRYSHLIADGNEEQVPERYRQKVARILDEAERGEGS